jgi:hypothetical protein
MSRTVEEEFKVMEDLELAYAAMPEDASMNDLLEMIASVTGQSPATVKKKYRQLKRG